MPRLCCNPEKVDKKKRVGFEPDVPRGQLSSLPRKEELVLLAPVLRCLKYWTEIWNSRSRLRSISTDGCFQKKNWRPEVSTFSKFLGVLSMLLLNSTCFAEKRGEGRDWGLEGDRDGGEEGDRNHRCTSRLPPPALGRWPVGSRWNFEGRCQWKPNRSGWKRTESEPACYTHNPSVPTLWGCLRQGRRCAGPSHGRWSPQSWGKWDPSLHLSLTSLRRHSQQLVELGVHQWRVFIRKAVSSGQLMSMYSGSMSFKINSTPCYSIHWLHTKVIERFVS